MLYTVSAVPRVTPPFSPLRIPLPESWFGPTTFLRDLHATDVARAVRHGHFVMARLDEHGEQQSLGDRVNQTGGNIHAAALSGDVEPDVVQIGPGLWRYPVRH